MCVVQVRRSLSDLFITVSCAALNLRNWAVAIAVASNLQLTVNNWAGTYSKIRWCRYVGK